MPLQVLGKCFWLGRTLKGGHSPLVFLEDSDMAQEWVSVLCGWFLFCNLNTTSIFSSFIPTSYGTSNIVAFLIHPLPQLRRFLLLSHVHNCSDIYKPLWKLLTQDSLRFLWIWSVPGRIWGVRALSVWKFLGQVSPGDSPAARQHLPSWVRQSRTLPCPHIIIFFYSLKFLLVYSLFFGGFMSSFAIFDCC